MDKNRLIWYIYNTGANKSQGEKGFKEFDDINEAIEKFKTIKTPQYCALGVNKRMYSIDLAKQQDGNLKISNDYKKSSFADNTLLTGYYLNIIERELEIKRGA